MQYSSVTRRLSRSIVTYRRPLVGPIDPISNLRPSLYGPPQNESQNVAHPYSVEEFALAGKNYSEEDEAADMLWRLQQESLDQFAREFWTDNNIRFEAARQAVLDAHPSPPFPTSAHDVAAHDRNLEQTLSIFYATWLKEESLRHRAFTREWNRRNYASLLPTFRKHWREWIRRLRNGRPDTEP